MLAEKLEHTLCKRCLPIAHEKMLRTLIVRKNTNFKLKLHRDYFTAVGFDDKDGHHQIAASVCIHWHS